MTPMTQKSIIILLCLVTFTFSNVIAQNNKVSANAEISNKFLNASRKYLDGDFANAIPLYKEVLKHDSLLKKEYWYVLIDNLGMSYGMTGDLKSAEKIFKYGLSKDSIYPLFYYNLACTYAGKNDLSLCLFYLKSAYKYKNNMMPEESFPDPAEDDSFKIFMNNKKFITTLNELKKGNFK